MHRTGRVGRAGDQDAGNACAGFMFRRFDRLGRQRMPGRAIDGDLDDFQAQSRENVAISRVTGPGDDDQIAGIEQLQKRQIETG